MKKGNSSPISPALSAELQELASLGAEHIDTSDAPQVKNWEGARRGVFYRVNKKQQTFRIDADVLAWFQASGPGYQTRVNQALRDYYEKHKKKDPA